MLLSCSFTGSNPILEFSFLSAHRLLLSAAALSLPISLRCFSFSACWNASFFSLFSHHVEKLPACISIVDLFKTSTWSHTASKRSLSCDTRINPFFEARYSFIISRALVSKWFVGSSIRRNSFSAANSTANITLVRSPKLSVPNGLYKHSGSILSSFIWIRTCQISICGFHLSMRSTAFFVRSESNTVYGK